MQIYTNFESNSQLQKSKLFFDYYCFRCKFTQILKAIHNARRTVHRGTQIVSDANLHKFWKQFTTGLHLYRRRRDCFRCKFTQILKAIHNRVHVFEKPRTIVSDANLHKFWKQFTTLRFRSLQSPDCFRCKFTQILKAIHNIGANAHLLNTIVSDANLHKFWKQFTTWH